MGKPAEGADLSLQGFEDGLIRFSRSRPDCRAGIETRKVLEKIVGVVFAGFPWQEAGQMIDSNDVQGGSFQGSANAYFGVAECGRIRVNRYGVIRALGVATYVRDDA